MKIRAIVLLLVLGFVVAFTSANWGAITTPTQVSMLVTRVEAPLGLILLMFLVVVTLVFLFLMVYQQAGAMLEMRRAAKELAAQRALADQAEASRFTELRKHLDARLDKLHDEVGADGDTLGPRLDRLEKSLRDHIDATGNTLAAYIGEVDDRVERLAGGAPVGTAVSTSVGTPVGTSIVTPASPADVGRGSR